MKMKQFVILNQITLKHVINKSSGKMNNAAIIDQNESAFGYE